MLPCILILCFRVKVDTHNEPADERLLSIFVICVPAERSHICIYKFILINLQTGKATGDISKWGSCEAIGEQKNEDENISENN